MRNQAYNGSLSSVSGDLEMGPNGITGQNIGRAILKFFIVAGGGTLLGIIFGFVGAYITK